MELEDLQKQWQQLDSKIEKSLKQNDELFRLAVMQPARRRINRSTFWLSLDVASCIAVLLFTGSFLFDHRDHAALVGISLGVMLAAISLLISTIRQFQMISQIKWSETLINIQSSLSRIRMAKISQFKWIILLSPLAGFCGLIVGLQWLMDRLPEPHFILNKVNPAWVVGNIVFGLLFIPAGQLIVKVLAKRFHGTRWWERAIDDLSGTSMKNTRAELNQWVSLNETMMPAANN